MQFEIQTLVVKPPLQEVTCTQMVKEYLLGHLDFWKGCFFAPCYSCCCPLKFYNTEEGFAEAKQKITADYD
jgi:hypothetical protein